jgi:hypothetical protein
MDAGQPASGVFGEAFRSGAMPLAKADLVSRFVNDVRAVADPNALTADMESLVEAASDNHRGRGLTVKELRSAIHYATQLIKPAKDLERDEDRRRLARSLHKSQGPAGMSRYQLTLDAEGAAILDAAVRALSAPVKGPGGEPDRDPPPPDARMRCLRSCGAESPHRETSRRPRRPTSSSPSPWHTSSSIVEAPAWR